jgi:long-subunit fatty acid transport protein
VRRAPRLLVAVAILFASATASAENLEQFGLGPRAQAMGGAFTALASDGTAAYYNPAGLVLSRHVNLTLGFSYADFSMDFESENGGPGVDTKATRIPPLAAVTLALSTTFPLDEPDRLGLGLVIFAPTRGIIDLEADAESTQPEWFSYGKRHNRLQLIPAVGVKITDWASFGLGIPLVLSADGRTRIEGGLTEPVETTIDLGLDPGFGAVVSLMLTPKPWLSFGLTYRSEIKMEVEFDALAILEGIALPVTLESVQYFSPHQVQAGAAVDLTEDLLVTVDASWVNWSAYETVFLEVTSPSAAVLLHPDVDLQDVFSVKIGAELAATDWLMLRGGYSFRTSPIEDQGDEPTNLVDSPKHMISLGFGLAFGQEPEEITAKAKEKRKGRSQTIGEVLEDASLDMDFFFQYHIHPEVSADKPGGDPVGDWDSDGTIVNAGFMITARF